jgi:two-component system, response regulator
MSDRSILLVEDNPDDEALTLRALKINNIGNAVTVARDGAEALEYLFTGEDPAPSPALILLDLKLPKINGLEVLRRIRADQRTRLVPVVILTTSVEYEDVLAGYRAGVNAYVRKPVEFADFAGAVSTIASFWLQVNEPPADVIAPSPASGAPAG